MHRLAHLWRKFLSTFWFIPSAFAVGGFVLALCTGMLDVWLADNWPPTLDAILITTGGSARSLLDIIAGSTITVAGVIFSITMVALANASSNYGPRLLETFRDDRGSQVTLGIFLGTFVYGLLVQRLIVPATDASEAFVPRLGVLFAMMLALTAVFVLIYFVHHVVELLSVAKLTARIGTRLGQSITQTYPHTLEPCEAPPPTWRHEDALAELEQWPLHVDSDRCGYLERVDREPLLELARQHDLTVALHVRCGEFALEGMRLASLKPRAPGVVYEPDEEARLVASVRESLPLGHLQLSPHNVELLIDQLVEVAERALSPGINDALVARASLDWLSQALRELGRRRLDVPRGGDPDRLREPTHTFADFVRLSFGALRPDLRGNRNAALYAVSLLCKLTRTTACAAHREVLSAEIRQLAAHLDGLAPDDVSMLECACEDALAHIEVRFPCDPWASEDDLRYSAARGRDSTPQRPPAP